MNIFVLTTIGGIAVLCCLLILSNKITPVSSNESSTAAMEAGGYSTKHRYSVALKEALIGHNSSYDKSVIPTVSCAPNSHHCPPFVVQCRLYIIRIQEIVENDETLITTARLQLSWVDPALRWNPADYGGLRDIILPPRSIWAPDLQLANSIDNVGNLMNNGEFSFRVISDGRVWYHPNGRFATRCGLDLTYYPFDYQKCSFVLESLVYTSEELITVIRPDKPDPVTRGMYSENPMWALIDANGFPALYKTGTKTMFSRIHFWLILKRKPDYYQMTMLLPLILLSILQTLTYLTPMQFIDRVPQATVVLMTAFFFQGYIAAELPRTSTTSFVKTYLNLVIAMSVFTISLTTLTIELVQPDDGLPLWGILPLVTRRRRKGVAASPPESDKKRVLSKRRATLIAAAVNWLGFSVNACVSIIYPLAKMAVLQAQSAAPAMPEPTADNITNSYLAEY